MIFKPEQIQEILKTVDMNTKFLAAKVLGSDILTKEDKKDLEKWGFNLEEIQQEFPSFVQSYHFGRLSALIGDVNSKKISYKDFIEHLRRGQYLPLTEVEKYSLNVAKQRTYGHITGLGEGMKTNISQVIRQTEQERRADYEKVIKKELEKGVADRKSLKEIVSDLGHKTGDWSRNWGRIVSTEMNNIFQQGRSDMYKERYGDDVRVYKDVYPKACRHCIKAYTTSGLGSKPRVFKLSELEANGSNIGKKVADWLPTLQGMHPYCRCTLRNILPGQVWDEETESFKFKVDEKLREKYKNLPKIKISVGDKKFEV